MPSPKALNWLEAGIHSHPGETIRASTRRGKGQALKTTFGNPQPELKVPNVDYASTETITCPFLVGLTVD